MLGSRLFGFERLEVLVDPATILADQLLDRWRADQFLEIRSRRGPVACHEADELVARQLARVDAKIQRLQALRDALSNMLEACPHDVVADCAVFRSLSAHGVAAD